MFLFFKLFNKFWFLCKKKLYFQPSHVPVLCLFMVSYFIHDSVPVPQFLYVPVHDFVLVLCFILSYNICALYRYQMIFVFRTGIALLYRENWCYLWFFFFILAVCKHSNVFIEFYLNKSCIHTSTGTEFFYDSVLVSQFLMYRYRVLYRYYFIFCTGIIWVLCFVPVLDDICVPYWYRTSVPGKLFANLYYL